MSHNTKDADDEISAISLLSLFFDVDSDSVVKEEKSSADELFKGRLIKLILYFCLMACLLIGQDFYEGRFDRANSSTNFVSEPLQVFSFRHDTTTSDKNVGHKILNVIAREGTFRFYNDEKFKLSKKLYLVNNKYLCHEPKLSDDCLVRFRGF